MASSTLERSAWILLVLMGVFLVTSGSADAISNPLFPPESLENPTGSITNQSKDTKDHTPSTTEVPKTTPTDHSTSVATERTITTTHPSAGPDAHSVTPPTTSSPATTTTPATSSPTTSTTPATSSPTTTMTPATPTVKPGEPVTVHMFSTTPTPTVSNKPLPSHVLEKLQDHHDNIVTAESHTPPPDTPPVTASPIIFPQHTPQGPVTPTPQYTVTTSSTAAPSRTPTTMLPSVTTSPAVVPDQTLTSLPPKPKNFAPTTSTPKPTIDLPLFPPVQPNPLALFGNIYTGLMGVTSAFINSLPNPFKRDPEPPTTPNNNYLNSVSLAMATPFVFVGAKLGVPLIIISSTLAIPVVKAGGFFAIPFIKGKNEKESVPLFVVTDSVNSFAMQIDAPDIKPTIEAGQLIIVARTPATEKLLEPLLNALKSVNSGVQEQTIILQPVLKAQTLDNNATPSDLAQVVRDVRKILNLQTLSDQVSDAVENIKSSVYKAKDAVHQTIKSGITNIFGTDSDDSTDKRRAPHSAPQMPSQVDDDSTVPTVWVTPAPYRQPPSPAQVVTPAPVNTPHPNIPLVEEVHYSNGVQRRSKRDVSEYPDLIDVVEVGTKRPYTKKPYVRPSVTVVPSVKYSQTVKPVSDKPSGVDQIPKDLSPERLLECSAVLTEMSTTECHRIENYTLKSCRTDLLSCKNVAQQDLTRLMGLCNQPTADFMCDMKSIEQRETEVVDGKAASKVCQAYNFKIVRIFDTKSPLCNDQLKCVFGKQFGCRTRMP